MDYIVNDKVIVTNDGMRTVGSVETEIPLTAVPIRLLMFLIEHKNIALTRDEVLYAVWTAFGLKPSGTSLSQHISKLRKCFREFDIDENIIKTLPQKGIIFKGTVKPVYSSGIVNKSSKNIWFKGWYFIMILSSLFTGAIFFLYYQELDKPVHKNLNYVEWHSIGKLHSCDVLSHEKNIENEYKKYLFKKTEKFILSQKINCKFPSEILVDLDPKEVQVNQELSGDRKFFSFCQKLNNEYQCDNFYYSFGVTQ